MHPTDGVPPSKSFSLLRWLLTLVLLDLGLLLVVVFVHGLQPVESLITVAETLTVVLAALTGASILAGLSFAWRSFHQHRRVVIFLVSITLITLFAHAYIIGTPAAFAPSVVAGSTGTTFHDDYVIVKSSLAAGKLVVNLTASGDQAIANVNVTIGNTKLIEEGFQPRPSLTSPLEPACYPVECGILRPAQSVTETWSGISVNANATLTISYLHLTCYAKGSEDYGCIMDEVFYVPEGMGMLAGQNCSPTGTNCHMEHPILVPALMAGGMAIFGTYNVVGWRFFPALLGSFSIPLLFGIAWKVSGSKRIAYISSLLLALDVMFFSQSSAGLLDVPEVFFALAGFFAYFANLRVWKVDKFVVSGILFGAAGLAKESAVFIAAAFLTYLLFFGEGRRQERIYDILKVTLVIGLVFSGGLQAYDSTLASAAFPTFVGHISYIFSYGSSLIAHTLLCQAAPTSASGYWCKYPSSSGNYAPILPTDWILYYSPVAYYATSVTVSSGGSSYSYVALAYYGVTNLLETWTVFVWVPLVSYVLYSKMKRPEPGLEQFGFDTNLAPSTRIDGETRFAAFALIFFAWSYVPYIFLFLGGRVTYPFYFIPAIPAVAMGCAYWVTRTWFPKWLLGLYLGMVFIFFFVYFPEKAFLPDWLRVIIGH